MAISSIMLRVDRTASREAPLDGRDAESRPSVSWSGNIIRYHDPRLFAGSSAARCESFLRRILRLDEVRSVEIDRALGTATIRCVPNPDAVDQVLERMAGALRNGEGYARESDAGSLPPLDRGQSKIAVFRYGTLLTTWQLVHELPGRVRFRNEALRSERELEHRIALELPSVHGVESCHVNPTTASLLVRFDPDAIDVRRLLLILESMVSGSPISAANPGDPQPARFGLQNASVGLAAAGEFFLPVLLPASAGLLIATNLSTFRAAWHELRERRPGLPVLYTTIVVATLSSGQFLAAALMGWMLKFWRRQHREEVLTLRRRLLPGIAQHHRFAHARRGNAWVELAVERLQTRDVIRASAGELIAADGRILGGSALVDECVIQGVDGLSRKEPGDDVYAGSRVIQGDITIEVSALGPATRAAALCRTIFAASTQTASRSRLAVTGYAEETAGKAVVPTLAAAGVGLLVGDLTTAAAVLRPDYATGPGLGLSLNMLHDAALCAREGILIRDASAFRRLADVDVIVFDDGPALERKCLAIESVAVDDGRRGDEILELAAAAFHELADERARALWSACEARGIAPRLAPLQYASGRISYVTGGEWIVVEDGAEAGAHRSARGLRAACSIPAPVLVSIDGRPAGALTFRRNGRRDAESIIRELRDACGIPIGLLTDRTGSDAQSFADALGVDFHDVCGSAESRVDVLRRYRAAGARVAYVGDCRLAPAAAESHVAISLSGDPHRGDDPAHVVLLSGDLSRIGGLMDLARSHVSRVRLLHGSTVIPNLACVAGAFLLGFTSMSSVVITNLGTFSVYTHCTRRARIQDRRRSAAKMAGSSREAKWTSRS